MFEARTNYGVKYTYTPHQVAEDYAATVVQFEDNKLSESELYGKIIVDPSWLSQWWSDYLKFDIEVLHSTAKVDIVDQEEYDDFFLSCMYKFGGVL